VEGIVAVAVELADESGFPAISMPKIASRLGVTANAPYRYVASKEELVVLMADAGWGSPEVPDAPWGLAGRRHQLGPRAAGCCS
jgi:AcrR family transcriptional regulator